MIITIAIILFVIGVVTLVAIGDDIESAFFTLVLVGGFFAACIIGAFGSSFASAVDIDATYEGVLLQHSGAISVYEDKAIVRLDGVWTDFAAQGYNKEIAQMITDLRNVITKNNRLIIEKRQYAKNPFFSWFIIMPENAKIMDIQEMTQRGAHNSL